MIPLRTLSGGAVIAFVGSEATGKSTMLAETEQWLGEHFVVRRVHAGKPPPTLLTVAPNLFLPALRALVPTQRSTCIDAAQAEPEQGESLDLPPMLFAVRAVLLAHDRRALLGRAHAESAHGTLVLCDRYPSTCIGAPDSPQLARWAAATTGHPFLGWLVRAETRLYRRIPPADVVFHLEAPLDVTLQRNRDRAKTEPEDLVKLRHRQSGTLRFDGSLVHVLDTTRPLAESMRQVREVLRGTLRASCRRAACTVDEVSSI
jgi:thymidylate kinase